MKSSDSSDYMKTLYCSIAQKIHLCQNTFSDDSGDGSDGSGAIMETGINSKSAMLEGCQFCNKNQQVSYNAHVLSILDVFILQPHLISITFHCFLTSG